ncbi:hypothetical protein CEUSTIGMA_g5756.t1 [Chlamydomonas eustigma]|uniref:GOLD domain-containing protein n=1 Tax=Chlamydomonas eustigma TaxID=1157962 RepID=A0A250X5F2_9CHLO|nr:hypothetical protein CEUSTIGMA_g5756.t1 [Chlamydomonas eustigma]|eukprot:GAX78314.1 hypothetical protein CEUSTIGMA_g5756.t1 [Chlamydomonas eustigma]
MLKQDITIDISPVHMAIVFVYVLCTACLLSVSSLKIRVPAGLTECVAELVADEHFTIAGPRIDSRLLVGSTSAYYHPFVHVKVYGPHRAVLWEQTHVYSEAHVNIPAHGPGKYEVCISNPRESRTEAIVDVVYFTLAHLRSGRGTILIPKGTQETRSTAMAHQDDVDAAKRTIMSMREFVEVISGSQQYLQRKLDRHKQTVVSSSHRAKGYALLEMVVILSLVAVQVLTITKFFESGKVRIITAV